MIIKLINNENGSKFWYNMNYWGLFDGINFLILRNFLSLKHELKWLDLNQTSVFEENVCRMQKLLKNVLNVF